MKLFYRITVAILCTALALMIWSSPELGDLLASGTQGLIDRLAPPSGEYSAIYLNLLLGVVSGAISAIIIFGFRRVWVGMVIPEYKEIIYRDAKIEGTWFGHLPATDSSGNLYKIKIDRQAHDVIAHMTCISGGDRGRDYILNGQFKNLILSATYESDSRECLDRGSITLALRRNGTRLEGHIAYYDDSTHEIDTTAFHWFKSKEEFYQQIVAMRQFEEFREAQAAKREEEKLKNAKNVSTPKTEVSKEKDDTSDDENQNDKK